VQQISTSAPLPIPPCSHVPLQLPLPMLQMRDTVRQVAHLFPTAIISGRGRDKVEAFVQLPELFYAGSHGMDIAGPQVSTSSWLDGALPQLQLGVEQLQTVCTASSAHDSISSRSCRSHKSESFTSGQKQRQGTSQYFDARAVCSCQGGCCSS
jgi:hypothetical protein